MRFDSINCPPGSLVRVWSGAFTATHGTPPSDATGPLCRVSHWNSVPQAYVVLEDLEGELPPSGNVGMYVFPPAILELVTPGR